MTISLFAGSSVGVPTCSLSSFRVRPAQEPVKDHVVVEAPVNPYQALREASNRLNAGKSLFFTDEVDSAEQGNVQRGRQLLSEI